jgi:hypothetical protein
MKSALIALVAPILLGLCAMFGLAGCDPCPTCAREVPTTIPTFTPRATPTSSPIATPSPAGSGTPTATPTLAPEACLPSSSLGVLVQGTNATIYAPLGNWGGGPVGVKVVPIETKSGIGTGGAPATVTTASTVNSCSSNSATGQTVCVANTTDVYVITGTTLSNTLASGSNARQGFSGGGCNNCGVVVDSSTNQALITMGLTPDGPGGYQFLDLASAPPAFETPIPAGTNTTPVETSEDASIDPIRHLVLSPNEQSNYQIINTSAGTTKPAIFNNDLSSTIRSGEMDSAGEDCTTGIALATIEGTPDLFIADLTQAAFNSTSATWSDAASQVQTFPEFTDFSAGTCGIAVAPGTHLGVVTGEFGGALEGVIQLPATSGTGTPAVTDWVSFIVPNDPTGAGWNQGFDPHTVTAYVSPNSKKAFGVLENDSNAFLAVVDLQGLLSAPRTGHVVNMPIPSGLITFVAE